LASRVIWNIFILARNSFHDKGCEHDTDGHKNMILIFTCQGRCRLRFLIGKEYCNILLFHSLSSKAFFDLYFSRSLEACCPLREMIVASFCCTCNLLRNLFQLS